MSLTPQFLDELRARTTLSALIGRSIKVTKAGREYKACCPFHNEKTPSFTINDEKGFYHCFGCSAHGDAIRWMTDQRGLAFMDAVKELAAQAGMEVPALDPKSAKQAEQRAGLHDVMAAAQDWFVKQLQGIEGANARDYLAKRGISAQTIAEFGFGFAPDSRGKLREALKAFGDPMLVEAGLLIKVDDKEPYDRFRGRLMIPIRDPRGRVIAFGGRILGEGEPKYLNSPDTPLFDKGRTLYNLDRCSPASRSSGRVIVVEGYMDVIALAQAGFADAVAPLGTALTEQQLQMLWRMTDKPLICFDGDMAGRKAAYRAALRSLPIMEPGNSLKFVDIPPGNDPDDIIRANGVSRMSRLLDEAHSLADRIWIEERSKIPFGIQIGPDDRISLRDRLEKIAQTISNRNIAAEYQRALLNRFFEEFGFRKGKVSELSRAIGSVFRSDKNNRSYLTHRAVLLGLSRYPNVIRNSFEQILELPKINDSLDKMRSQLIELVMSQPDIEQDIIEQIWMTEKNPPFEPRDLQKDLAYSFYKKHDDPSKPESDLYMVIRAIIHDYKLDKEIKLARTALEADLNDNSVRAHRDAVARKQASRERIMEAFAAATNI
jgi:DNA primase